MDDHIERLFQVVLVLIVFLQVAACGAIVYGVYFFAREINEHGMRQVIERVWEGPDVEKKKREESNGSTRSD